MAIIDSYHREREHLRERIHRARSRDEAQYFEEQLYRLEREAEIRMGYGPRMAPPMMFDPRALPPSVGVDLEKPKAEPTALSFLSKADKKLLLTGALT